MERPIDICLQIANISQFSLSKSMTKSGLHIKVHTYPHHNSSRRYMFKACRNEARRCLKKENKKVFVTPLDTSYKDAEASDPDLFPPPSCSLGFVFVSNRSN